MLNLVQHLKESNSYETLKQVQGDKSGLFTKPSCIIKKKNWNNKLPLQYYQKPSPCIRYRSGQLLFRRPVQSWKAIVVIPLIAQLLSQLISVID